jgi:hypothetical protein
VRSKANVTVMQKASEIIEYISANFANPERLPQEGARNIINKSKGMNICIL